MEIVTDDYDSPWKEALEHYFPEFMSFFFPGAYAAIDWRRGYRFLEQELRQVVQDAELGKRYVDKLVEVAHSAGETGWVYIHIEVQGNREAGFAKRVFTYHYRLFDRYDRPIASLAVLADDHQGWHPRGFGYELLGCRIQLEFPVVKLLEWDGQLEALLVSDNPFAVVTAAHLLTKRTRRDSQARYVAKLRLIRMLYERDWDRQRIWNLITVIDWLMRLPAELESRLRYDVDCLEEERQMRYVTSFERMAREEGMQQGMQQGEARVLRHLLTRRFGALPEWVEQRLNSATAEQIEAWAERVIDADKLETVFH